MSSLSSCHHLLLLLPSQCRRFLHRLLDKFLSRLFLVDFGIDPDTDRDTDLSNSPGSFYDVEGSGSVLVVCSFCFGTTVPWIRPTISPWEIRCNFEICPR